jgi:hypothetical protein
MEVLKLTPYAAIPEPMLNELRVQLRYALAVMKEARPKLKTPRLESVNQLARKLRPRTRKQIEELEKKLTAALKRLRQMKAKLSK